MFLEAQFGPTITPLTRPNLPLPTPPTEPVASNKSAAADSTNAILHQQDQDQDQDQDHDHDRDREAEERRELDRLVGLGIPVPGLEIRVDKAVAKVWLEDLSVECAQKALRERVKAVVERACETVAPLWG